MSDPAGPPPETAPDGTGMYLANLVRDAVSARSNRGAPWLAENAVDPETGEHPFTRQSAYTLMNKPRKGFLDPDQVRAICALLGWSVDYVIRANAITVGLDLGTRGSFSLMVPAVVDELPPGDQMVGRDVLIQLARARGLIND